MLAPPSLLTSKTMIFTGFCKNNRFQCNEVPSSPGVPPLQQHRSAHTVEKTNGTFEAFHGSIAWDWFMFSIYWHVNGMLDLHTWGSLCDIATYLLDFFLKTFNYIKIFNWKRKEPNSNFQVRCAYQTTTNIALLWKMVRIPFLFPTRKKLSGIGSPTKKARVLIWTKKSLFEDVYIKILIGKQKSQIPIFRLDVHTRLLLT